tara:strand:+ start:2096 stop:2689 length:594 start_codon:yes stop_codon:yes gene_type:complete
MSDEEKIVSWLEDNYKGLILGVLIGLSILYGYKSYISGQNSAQLNISREYDVAVQNYNEGKTELIMKFSNTHMIENPNNIYTNLANLYSAKEMYMQNKLDKSIIYLNHVVNYSKDQDIVNLAKYRKSKILIEQKKYDDAHSLLGSKPENYQHIELKGDLYAIQKKPNEAITYYNDVLTYSITPNERKNIIAKINLVK